MLGEKLGTYYLRLCAAVSSCTHQLRAAKKSIVRVGCRARCSQAGEQTEGKCEKSKSITFKSFKGRKKNSEWFKNLELKVYLARALYGLTK